MFMGEHAVLFGHKAIACAIDKRIHVTLTPRPDRQCRVSSALGSYQAHLDCLTPEPKLSFVIAAIDAFNRQSQLPSGFEMDIRSEFSHTVGLGSSAAVTAATVYALSVFTNSSLELDALFDQALAVIHTVQEGRGSGTDLAASLSGGLIRYRVNPRELVPLSGIPDISLFYSGYKMKTPDVLKWVEENAKQCPELHTRLYALMNDTTQAAERAIDREDWIQLGMLMNTYQGLMDALGVNDATLSDMIYQLRADRHVLGSKISGSGLGDCVLALGRPENHLSGYEQIEISVSAKGTGLND